jgi:hypothetical protein
VLLLLLKTYVLNVPLIAYWQAIARTCEHHVNENLLCANRKQRQFDYAPGQQVLKKMHEPTKLGIRTEGPYTIEHIQHSRQSWLVNVLQILWNPTIIPIPDLLNFGIFIGTSFF